MSSRPPVSRRAVAVRLISLCAAAGLIAGALTMTSSAETEPSLAAVPRADCGPGSRPETAAQGRVPSRDYRSGRAARGYTCNTKQVGRFGDSGGFKVFRYVDQGGRVCAYYDSTLLVGTDVPYNAGQEGLGVIVLDMDDPTRPRQTDALSTVGMDSPHESLLLNERRGLLVAVSGNPGTAPGVLDVYDVSDNCRHPALRSSFTPSGILGHESGFAPDGKTFYVSSTGGQTLTAIDLADPAVPKVLAVKTDVVYHGMRLSADGNLLYVAEIGTPEGNRYANGGLAVLDVSQVQDRETAPEMPVVSQLAWRSGSIPQVPLPITIRGHKYLLEVDEYANFTRAGFESGVYQADAKVGAARMIDVDDPGNPRVVSNIRLQVNQPENRRGPQQNDPGAQSPVQGYAGHYCSVPRRVNPKIAACSFIASGLRIFDIRHPRHPKEIGYFNQPQTAPDAGREGAYAMSQPAWDLRRGAVWYTDGNTGFYVVKLTNGIAPRW